MVAGSAETVRRRGVVSTSAWLSDATEDRKGTMRVATGRRHQQLPLLITGES